MAGVVATFYKFVPCPDYAELRFQLLELCQHHHIKGTILLAPEGINSTLWGTQSALEAVLSELARDRRFQDLEIKWSASESSPFERLKVKLKREIVTFGVPSADPTQQVGTYVSPQEWNDLIQEPDVLVVDTRNDYEVEIGAFQGALNPETSSFRDFPDYVETHLNPLKHPKVAMYCTGGIRCEKASAYLLSQGFQEVYHLKGGILKYLEDIPPDESLWHGECFVFDDRVALQHGLTQGQHTLCRSCGHPITAEDEAEPGYEPGISCPYCVERLTPEKRAKQMERQRQWLEAQQQS
jgi:UPF0176 protein